MSVKRGFAGIIMKHTAEIPSSSLYPPPFNTRRGLQVLFFTFGPQDTVARPVLVHISVRIRSKTSRGGVGRGVGGGVTGVGVVVQSFGAALNMLFSSSVRCRFAVGSVRQSGFRALLEVTSMGVGRVG